MYGAPPSITAEIYTEVPEALRIRGRSSEWLYGRGGAAPHSFLEGPSFDREGNLWLTDIVFGRIFRVNPAGAWTVVAEYDGEPVAFMLVLPDINEKLASFGGSLFPFNWAKLLWWLRRPKLRTMRVPLMGVLKRLQSSRMASQLAFMMIEYIRRNAISHYGASRGEIGWILDDNQGMNAIAEAINSHINKDYWLYDKAL